MAWRSALLAAATLAVGVVAESFNATVVHNVTVSKVDGKFVPNNTIANPGDIVQFFFYPTNHSVVQAAPGNACVPIEDVVPGQNGFFSGHFIITDSSNPPPTWNLTINDTNPIYYYCSAIGSCQNGMIGGINLPNATDLSNQLQDALHAPFMIDSGEIPPLSASVNSSSTSSSSSSPQSSSSPSHSGLSGGAIAGIVIAAIAIIILLGAVFWLLGRHKGLVTAGVVSAGGSNNGGLGNYSRAARTEQWADSSAVGGAPAPSEQATWSPEMGYMPHSHARSSGAPMGWPYSPHPPHQQFDHAYAEQHGSGWHSPVMSPKVTNVQEIMELGGNEVTELEAPHVHEK